MLPSNAERVVSVLISTIGAIIVASAIFHALHTQILPLSYLSASFFVVVPGFFIGVLNEEPRDALFSMVLTTVGTIFLTAFGRSVPAFLGTIPRNRDLFIFQQVTETMPIFFFMIPLLILGTVFGMLMNDVFFKPKYKPKQRAL